MFLIDSSWFDIKFLTTNGSGENKFAIAIEPVIPSRWFRLGENEWLGVKKIFLLPILLSPLTVFTVILNCVNTTPITKMIGNR